MLHLSADDLQALVLTLKLAVVSTAVLLCIALPLAWWLARGSGRLKPAAITVLTMPLILPPTVLGFYLLLLFSPDSTLARSWQAAFGQPLAFSFSGLVIGSVIYSLPFMVQPIYIRFETVPTQLLNVASSLGASPFQRFLHIVLPMSKNAIMTGCCLAFAHTLGEFGVVLIIGGNIPGETRVLSIALYEHIETLQYQQAHMLAGALFVMAFSLMLLAYYFQRPWRKKWR